MAAFPEENLLHVVFCAKVHAEPYAQIVGVGSLPGVNILKAVVGLDAVHDHGNVLALGIGDSGKVCTQLLQIGALDQTVVAVSLSRLCTQTNGTQNVRTAKRIAVANPHHLIHTNLFFHAAVAGPDVKAEAGAFHCLEIGMQTEIQRIFHGVAGIGNHNCIVNEISAADLMERKVTSCVHINVEVILIVCINCPFITQVKEGLQGVSGPVIPLTGLLLLCGADSRVGHVCINVDIGVVIHDLPGQSDVGHRAALSANVGVGVFPAVIQNAVDLIGSSVNGNGNRLICRSEQRKHRCNHHQNHQKCENFCYFIHISNLL